MLLELGPDLLELVAEELSLRSIHRLVVNRTLRDFVRSVLRLWSILSFEQIWPKPCPIAQSGIPPPPRPPSAVPLERLPVGTVCTPELATPFVLCR